MSENNQKSNNNSEWTQRELGAIWMQKSGRTGAKYMTGQIKDPVSGESQRIVIFPNKSKKDEEGNIVNEKAPDFRIYKSEELGSKQQAASSPVQQTNKQTVEQNSEEEEEELAF